MDKENRNSFKSLILAEGMQGVKKVATYYAIESDDITLDIIAERYNLTLSATRSAISYSIVHCLISYRLAILCMEKSHRNQARHCKYLSASSSDRYYDHLFKRRFEFIKKLDEETVKRIVSLYLLNPGKTASSIAESLGFSLKELNIVLKKAIIFAIVDDTTVKKVESVTLKKCVSLSQMAHTRKLLFKYTLYRNRYKYLNAKISQLLLQLEGYDQFVSSDQEIEYTKDFLNIELDNAKNSLKMFKDSFYMGK